MAGSGRSEGHEEASDWADTQVCPYRYVKLSDPYSLNNLSALAAFSIRQQILHYSEADSLDELCAAGRAIGIFS
ncbi:MAG: hypothetical protein U9Q89_04430, partial [Thermodesulfobacteriota bacterium]|nr:hypothetical protein [Thermodesulfobacteriota bacterium]